MNQVSKMISRGLQFLFLSMLSLVVVSACTSHPESTSEPQFTTTATVHDHASLETVPLTTQSVTTIRFACPNQDKTEFESLAADFEFQNPTIHVEVLSVEEILSGQSQDRTYRLASSADAFFFLVDLDTVTRGYIKDLAPFIDSDPVFHPGDYFPNLLEAFQVNGKVWALPSEAWLTILYYDKDLFDQANVPYPELQWTREDFVNTASLLTKIDGQEVVQYGFVDNGGDAEQIYVGRSVGDFASEYPPLNSPEVIEATQWYLDLATIHRVMPEPRHTQGTRNQARNLISTQKVAMWSSVLVSDLDLYTPLGSPPRNLGAALFPSDNQFVVPATMYGYMLSAGTTHPQESWQWLHFLSRQRRLGPNQSGKERLPPRRSVTDQSRYWEQFNPELLPLVQLAAENLYIQSFFSKKRAFLSSALESVLDGADINEALLDAQVSFEEWLVAYDEANQVSIEIPHSEQNEDIANAIFAHPAGADSAPYYELADYFNNSHDNMYISIAAPDEIHRDCFAGILSVEEESTRNDLLNLEPLLQSDSSFSDTDWHIPFKNQYSFNGNLWGFPFQAQVRVIFYNKALFDSANVPYPQPGWSIREFLERAVALTEDIGQGKIYGFVPFNGDRSDLGFFLDLLGASPWNDKGEPQLDTDEMIAAIRWYADLASYYGVMPSFPGDLLGYDTAAQDARRALVRNGRTAMWSDFAGINRREFWPSNVDIGVVPMPIGVEGKTQYVFQGLFISRDSAHPDVCWEWMKFISSQVLLMEGLPAQHQILESAEFERKVGREVVDCYSESLEYTEVEFPSSYNTSAYMNWLYEALGEILQGARPEDSLLEAQRKANND